MARGEGWSDSFLESREWRTIRMRVLERHGAKCQCCGRTSRDGITINVDHIKPRAAYPELALTESNLQVLCNECNHGKGNWSERDWRPPAAPMLGPPADAELWLGALWTAIVADPSQAQSDIAKRFACISWAHPDDRALACLIDTINIQTDVLPTMRDVLNVWAGSEYEESLRARIDACCGGDVDAAPVDRSDAIKFVEAHIAEICRRAEKNKA
jgi:hypothetical protein